MDFTSPADAWIARLVEYIDDDGLLCWVEDFVKKNPDIDSDSPLMEILWINRKRKDEREIVSCHIKRFVLGIDPEFNPKSLYSQYIAKKLFRKRLEQYLDGDCEPWEVCRMISPIESYFDFPEWLGKMSDACDWIEPGHKPADCRHLEHEIRQHLADA